MKITRKYLQRIIREEVQRLVENPPGLPAGAQISINKIRRAVMDPEVVAAAEQVSQGRGRHAHESNKAMALKVALNGHPEGHAAAMSVLNGILADAVDAGTLKSETAQAMLSLIAPGDTAVHTDDVAMKAMSGTLRPDRPYAGHDYSATATAAEEERGGPLQESRNISKQLKYRRGIHPVVQRKQRR